MRHGSLFSGVGGFDLAAEWAGWTNVFHCEYNPFGQRVLKYYWPDSISYGDITDFTIHRGQIDVLSGGFPCQPFSTAGKRQGTEDDRHLWPEMLRAVREIQPRYVVGENVRGLTNWNGGLVFDQVQTDLEVEGYEVLPFLLPACAVNAPHRRDRIWIVAHAKAYNDRRDSGEFQGKDEQQEAQRQEERLSESGGTGQGNEFATYPSGVGRERRGCKGGEGRQDIRTETNLQRDPKGFEQIGPTPDTSGIGQQGQRRAERPGNSEAFRDWKASWSYDDGRWPTQPPIRQRNDGLPYKLDGLTISKHRKESIMAYGNAIVPQVAFEIFKAINPTEK